MGNKMQLIIKKLEVIYYQQIQVLGVPRLNQVKLTKQHLISHLVTLTLKYKRPHTAKRSNQQHIIMHRGN